MLRANFQFRNCQPIFWVIYSTAATAKWTSLQRLHRSCSAESLQDGGGSRPSVIRCMQISASDTNTPVPQKLGSMYLASVLEFVEILSISRSLCAAPCIFPPAMSLVNWVISACLPLPLPWISARGLKCTWKAVGGLSMHVITAPLWPRTHGRWP